jgi:CheY-like chemotaxis protein
LADVLNEALDLMRPLVAERGLDLVGPAPFDEETYVLSDRQRFKQVLLNLLSNAVKYTPSGAITVSHSMSANKMMRVEISDTGPGIPTDKLCRLFTAFDRLGAEASAIEGTGLGLALSQRLMHAMRGTIGATSVVGQGTTFWIELPCAESPLSRLASQKNNGASRLHSLASQKRTLLYIEDNLSNLTLIQQILADQPEIELLSAMQGQLGLDLARQHRPDLILLDLHLPDLPGREVLKQLRADENTRDIPVVILSADATAGQIKLLMAAGARRYLTKPIDVAEFCEAIEAISAPKPIREEIAAA